MSLPDGDPRPGTYNGYSNHACRCNACRAAGTAASYQHKMARRARGLSPSDPRHGRASSYGNWGCRCDLCTDAWAAEHRARRQRTTDRRAIAPATTSTTNREDTEHR